MNPQSGRLPAGRSRTIGLPHLSVRLGQVPHSVPAFMIDHGLASYDAVHAASAIAAGAKAIVTTDTGFALLPASLLTVYTDRSRLASCRKKRPRR
jgi:PIN domain